jgi:large conductance mechanosensitive channel
MTQTPQHETITEVIETPHGEVTVTRPKHHKGISVVLNTDDVLHDQATGFVNFMREYGVVGLAVGFIIGLQAQTLMKQLLESFLTPFLNLVLGNGLSRRAFTVGSGADKVTFAWGQFVYALISFLFVVLVIYLMVKLLRLDKLAKKK